MPVWMPARGGREGFGRFDITREVELGLTFRPLAVTARDTLDYYHAQIPGVARETPRERHRAVDWILQCPVEAARHQLPGGVGRGAVLRVD
jgi:hypothetical protein